MHLSGNIHSWSKTQAVVFCGLSLALMVVSAWFTVPIGPVPITLQTFVVIFMVLFLPMREGLTVISVYLLMGAVGLPVFSGMRGGFGILIGPTGGFLWGFLAGALAAYVVLLLVGQYQGRKTSKEGRGKKGHSVLLRDSQEGTHTLPVRRFLVSFVAASILLMVVYMCAWIQLVFLTGLTPFEAFLVGVVPFIGIDALKMVVAVGAVEAVKRAVGMALVAVR